MVPFTHSTFFHHKFTAIFLQCDVFTLDPFSSHNFCSVEWFFMLKLVALLFVFALLYVFPIDNRYEYILMHFKGLTVIYYEDCMTLPGWFEHNFLFNAKTYLHDVCSLIPRRHVLKKCRNQYICTAKIELDLSTGLLHQKQFLNLNDAIIWLPPFWDYDMAILYTIYWGWGWWRIAIKVCGQSGSTVPRSPGSGILVPCAHGQIFVAAQVWHGMS